MRKKLFVLFATGLSLVLSAGMALASPHSGGQGDKLYMGGYESGDCIKCHASSDAHTTGPHGGYVASTNKCNTCHDVHVGEDTRRGSGLAASMNEQLLPGSTLTAACNYCHDLTGTKDGPYNTTGSMAVGAAHRVEDLAITYSYTDSQGHLNNNVNVYGNNIIPGGDASDGVSGYIKTYANKPGNDYSDGSQGRLSQSVFTCDSCHTPHGINTVNRYLGESEVKVADVSSGVYKIYLTNRLLKQHPNGSATTVTEYGSQWCLGCHGGRDGLTTEDHNHPVDETLKGYYFLEEAGVPSIQTVIDRTYLTVGPGGDLAEDPRSNMQYALTATDESNPLKPARPDGNKTYADYKHVNADGSSMTNNGPSCQMCHGSARDVEATFAPLSNPARLSFPHISQNKALLVESNDDFCTNCHAPSMLP